MKTSRNLLLLLLFATASLTSNAQQHILAMFVAAIPPAGDTTQYGVPMINDSTTLFTATMNIALSNVDSIYSLHVKLGSTQGGSEYLSTSFAYGVSGAFGTSSYSQIGNDISLGLGSHAGMINFFAQVQIEKADHSLEDAILFSNN